MTRILIGTDPRAELSTTEHQADDCPMPSTAAFTPLRVVVVVVDGTETTTVARHIYA
ncbi:hypothetical protein [Rhodococcus sp. RS1C4]|nr:hypothetical protein [Rhodococcus sp. RS1C4]